MNSGSLSLSNNSELGPRTLTACQRHTQNDKAGLLHMGIKTIFFFS